MLFIVYEEFGSDDDAVDVAYVANAESEEDILKKWKEKYDLDEDDDNISETFCGNIFTYGGCKVVTPEEFEVLKKYLTEML